MAHSQIVHFSEQLNGEFLVAGALAAACLVWGGISAVSQIRQGTQVDYEAYWHTAGRVFVWVIFLQIGWEYGATFLKSGDLSERDLLTDMLSSRPLATGWLGFDNTVNWFCGLPSVLWAAVGAVAGTACIAQWENEAYEKAAHAEKLKSADVARAT